MPLESIDHASLLALVTADVALDALETELRKSGYTLAHEANPASISVAAWIESGAKGSPPWWQDPVDQLVAGFDATLVDGRTFKVNPVPRRAVGPDLFALVFGAEGAIARLDRVWLRIHKVGVDRPHTAPFFPPEAVLTASESEGEAKLWREIGEALAPQ
jgi:alkyldihydroxyacetonephosphate synthase